MSNAEAPALEPERRGFSSWPDHSPLVRLGTSDFASGSLSFLICKRRQNIVVFHRTVVRLPEGAHVHLAQG